MTNEVLQKIASDEQNISSSNGLEPSLRFGHFVGNWEKSKLSSLFKKCLEKNKNGLVDNVICNSAKNGLMPQRDFFDKDIANTENTNGYYIIQENDFVYNPRKSNEAPYGPISMYKYKDKGIVSPLYLCFRATKEIHPRYFEMYFKSSVWHKYIYFAGDSGARYDRVSIKDDVFFEMPINIPSLPEQQKIADFLSLVDRRIEKQRQLVESLKKYKRGLFLKLYNDSDKSIISFKNIYEMASEGGTPSTSDSENYENGKIPFIKIDDLNQHYLNFAKYFITEKGLKKSSAWIVPENSIIYSNGATIGACSINKIPVTTKQGILGIVPKSNFSVEFLYFFFTSSIFKQKIRAITTKGTMDCAYLKDINGIKISIPDFIAQQKIAKIMVDFENLIERTELSFIYLQNIKKALLQQMFI